MNLTIDISSHWKLALEHSIVSVSGWRFHTNSENPNQENSTLSPQIVQLVYIIAKGYVQFAKEEHISAVLLGRDTRPSGIYIQKIVQAVLVESGLQVLPLGIVASPELSCFLQECSQADAYVYLSASHNPIEYNGFKFGDGEGSIIDKSTVTRLYECVHTAGDEYIGIQQRINLPTEDALLDPRWKKESYESYIRMVHEYTSTQYKIDSTKTTKDDPLQTHILIDYNGSARYQSIDKEWIETLGYVHRGMYEQTIQHEIIPEGDSLHDAARTLEALNNEEIDAPCAYVYDCDGDRGNIVLHDGNRANYLDAQTHFALLTYLTLVQARESEEAIVVVNGATSHRIEDIAHMFGASVFRTEVGEKNLLKAVETLRIQNKKVIIIGEGSNGGAMLPSCKMRDPLVSLTTLLTFMKRQQLTKQNHFVSHAKEIACVLQKIPSYLTTESSNVESYLRMTGRVALDLHTQFQNNFLLWWQSYRHILLETHGIHHYMVKKFLGSDSSSGWSSDAEDNQTGGRSVYFYDAADVFLGRIWYRASGTEPVYRLVVDIPYKDQLSNKLYTTLHECVTTLLKRSISIPSKSGQT